MAGRKLCFFFQIQNGMNKWKHLENVKSSFELNDRFYWMVSNSAHRVSNCVQKQTLFGFTNSTWVSSACWLFSTKLIKIKQSWIRYGEIIKIPCIAELEFEIKRNVHRKLFNESDQPNSAPPFLLLLIVFQRIWFILAHLIVLLYTISIHSILRGVSFWLEAFSFSSFAYPLMQVISI